MTVNPAGAVGARNEPPGSLAGDTLTRLAALGTLSRNAGEGLHLLSMQLLSRNAGEGGPSPKGLVGEGSAAFRLVPRTFVK